MIPIATYRTERGRLALLTDLGQENGVYAGANWIAMRADVALKLLELGRCGFGPQAASTLRLFYRAIAVPHDGTIDDPAMVWRRKRAGEV